eukprot:TRINITY_DN67589_c4_g1_i3.p1 TRINITY_DN67589_c4_g1~~TRINITY_DN67589_c4_g1_i3.p1  ORF type:complete len:107 (-),score=0.41 TRINITY_DN67589_c4_g1_i3:546-866(-)
MVSQTRAVQKDVATHLSGCMGSLCCWRSPLPLRDAEAPLLWMRELEALGSKGTTFLVDGWRAAHPFLVVLALCFGPHAGRMAVSPVRCYARWMACLGLSLGLGFAV